MQLASVYVDQLLLHLEDESTLKLWRAKGDYPLLLTARSATEGTFLSFIV